MKIAKKKIQGKKNLGVVTIQFGLVFSLNLKKIFLSSHCEI